jgi:hypothetical protein
MHVPCQMCCGGSARAAEVEFMALKILRRLLCYGALEQHTELPRCSANVLCCPLSSEDERENQLRVGDSLNIAILSIYARHAPNGC